MAAALTAQLSDLNINGNDQIHITKSELDSHANMVVLGRDCFIFNPLVKHVMLNLSLQTLVSLQIYQF